MATVTIFRPAGHVRCTSMGVALLLHLAALMWLPAMSSPPGRPVNLTVRLNSMAPRVSLEMAHAGPPLASAAPAKRIARASAIAPDKRVPQLPAQERMVRGTDTAAPPAGPVVAQSATPGFAQTAASAPAAPSAPSTPAAPVAAATHAAAPAPPQVGASYLNNPAPAYPEMSRRTGEQGQVLLRVLVDVSGRPSAVELRASSGSARLDRAALEAVRQWKFVPATQGGEMIAAWVTVPVVFNLTAPS